MFWVGVAVTVYVLVTGAGIWPNVLTRAKPGRRAGPAPKLETIWFVDGPLAGRTDDLPAGPDGLPPYQFCALVARPTHEGGDYTLPYQRGPICETKHAWQYTQGWTRKTLPMPISGVGRSSSPASAPDRK